MACWIFMVYSGQSAESDRLDIFNSHQAAGAIDEFAVYLRGTFDSQNLQPLVENSVKDGIKE